MRIVRSIAKRLTAALLLVCVFAAAGFQRKMGLHEKR